MFTTATIVSDIIWLLSFPEYVSENVNVNLTKKNSK